MQDIKDIGVYNPPVKAIIPVTLPSESGVILYINNKPLNAVYDATKSKCEVVWAERVIWTFMMQSDAHAKLLFSKLPPTFVVTKELISFTRKPDGQMNPQYKTKLTTIVTAPLQGKFAVATVELLDDSYVPNNEYPVNGDYALGVNVKRENKERLCLIALNENREVVVNYPYQNNDFTKDIGKVDETTWGINIDGALIDATLMKTAIELLGVSVSNPGNGSGTGANPGTGTGGGNTDGSGTGTNPDTGTGGNTGGETGGTGNPPVQEVKPSYLKFTDYVPAT